MTLLNDADAIYVGSTPVDKVYAGSNLVWEPSGGGEATTMKLMTSFTPGTVRSDFQGQAGVRLNIVANKEFTWIGAMAAVNGLGLQHVAVYDWYTLAVVAEATVDFTGKAAGEWAWAQVPPFTLATSPGYYALVANTYFGVGWVNAGPTTFDPSITGNIYSCYRGDNPAWAFDAGSVNYQFFGVDLGWEVILPPKQPVINPPVTSGLAVYHDADQLNLANNAPVTAWPNLGTANQPSFIGSGTTLALRVCNGRDVVRFTPSGAMRGSNQQYAPDYPMRYTYTLFYVARWRGPVAGRCFTSAYPQGSNAILGYHSSGFDAVHDSVIGWWVVPTAFGPAPGPWRMYGMTGEGGVGAHFYFNGVDKVGLAVTPFDLQYYYNINGYELAGFAETGDFDLCEFLMYDRKLSDAERVQVEGYLRTKWGIAAP
jgi:hypothetical protein